MSVFSKDYFGCAYCIENKHSVIEIKQYTQRICKKKCSPLVLCLGKNMTTTEKEGEKKMQ